MFRHFSILEPDACQCLLCIALKTAIDETIDADQRTKLRQELHDHRRDHLMTFLACPEAQPILDYCHLKREAIERRIHDAAQQPGLFA